MRRLVPFWEISKLGPTSHHVQEPKEELAGGLHGVKDHGLDTAGSLTYASWVCWWFTVKHLGARLHRSCRTMWVGKRGRGNVWAWVTREDFCLDTSVILG